MVHLPPPQRLRYLTQPSLHTSPQRHPGWPFVLPTEKRQSTQHAQCTTQQQRHASGSVRHMFLTVSTNSCFTFPSAPPPPPNVLSPLKTPLLHCHRLCTCSACPGLRTVAAADQAACAARVDVLWALLAARFAHPYTYSPKPFTDAAARGDATIVQCYLEALGTAEDQHFALVRMRAGGAGGCRVRPHAACAADAHRSVQALGSSGSLPLRRIGGRSRTGAAP